MTRYLIILATLSSALCTCGQPETVRSKSELTIDPGIKTKVENHITPSEFGAGQDIMLIYNNRMIVDIYEEGKLTVSVKEQDNKSSVFKSFYYWRGDTLHIDGAFGLFGGTGFSMQVAKGNPTLRHMLASDEYPSYAYSDKDTLIFRLEVPCKDEKIVLSEIPTSGEKSDTIYGYVEFKSEDYYASAGKIDGVEILPRKRQSAEMKVYFKSAKLNHEQ